MKKYYKNQEKLKKNQEIIKLNLEIKELELEKEKILNIDNTSFNILFGLYMAVLGYLFNEIMNLKIVGNELGIIIGKLVMIFFISSFIIFLLTKIIKPSLKDIDDKNEKIKTKNKQLLEIIYK